MMGMGISELRLSKSLNMPKMVKKKKSIRRLLSSYLLKYTVTANIDEY